MTGAVAANKGCLHRALDRPLLPCFPPHPLGGLFSSWLWSGLSSASPVPSSQSHAGTPLRCPSAVVPHRIVCMYVPYIPSVPDHRTVMTLPGMRGQCLHGSPVPWLCLCLYLCPSSVPPHLTHRPVWLTRYVRYVVRTVPPYPRLSFAPCARSLLMLILAAPRSSLSSLPISSILCGFAFITLVPPAGQRRQTTFFHS